MDVLVALLGFAFVSSVTPGPNNVLLWASGAAFGFRRSIRHILGTAVGIGAMALTVGVGLGVLLATLPQVALAMRVGASGYLLVLAYRIAAANTIERPAIAKPLDLRQAAAFQALNPDRKSTRLNSSHRL